MVEAPTVLGLGILNWLPQVAVAVLHVGCMVHVLRRGQDYWWLFVIFFFPFFGAAAYLIVVVLPEWRSRRGMHGADRHGGSLRRRIRRLEETASLSDTVDNRAQLAAAYCEAGLYDQARQAYEHCLSGPHGDGADLLYGMAQACYGQGDFGEALACLERVRRGDAPEYANARELLRAKCLAALGEDTAASDLLQAVAPRLPTFEGWWRLAAVFAKLGRDDEADGACRHILSHAKQMNPVFRRREQVWIRHAKERLKMRSRQSSGRGA